MNCRFIKRHLQDFLDNLIDKDLSDAIEIHLHNCDSCSQEFQSLKKLVSNLHDSGYPQLTKQKWNAIHDSILASLPAHQKNNLKVLDGTSPFSIFFSPPLRVIAALLILSLITISALFFPNISNITFLSPFKKDTYPKIVAINGQAFFYSNTSSLVQVTSDLSMLPGRSIQTDSISSLQIKVDEKSAINVGQNTQCSVKDYTSEKTVFSLKKGGLNAQVSKRKPHQLFRIETPNAFCEVIGTHFDVTTQHDAFRKRHITTLLVREGIVKFGSSESTLFVTAGNAIAMFGDSISATVSSDDSLIRQLHENPGKGKLSISSVPAGAKVFIDGVPSGITPFTDNFNYGFHSVRLSRNSFKEWAGTLEISAHTTTDTLVSMRKSPEKHFIGNKNAPAIVITTGELIENAILQDAFRLINNGYYNEAIVELDQLIVSTTSSALKAVAYHKLSVCYKNIGDIDNALKMLNFILTGNFAVDQKGLALFERATIYKTMLHNPTKAIVDYEKYLSQYRNGIWAEETALSLAELLRHEKAFKRAAEAYQMFCNNFKDNSQYEKALYTLGTIYYNNLSDYNRAMSTYSRLIQEFPVSRYSDDATYWGANCLLQLGHASRALAEFNIYLTRYPQGKWSAEAKTRLYRIETSEAK